MITIKLDVDVTSDRQILIDLPPEVRNGRHEIVLIVDEKDVGQADQNRRLQEYAGSIDWPMDGLLYQEQVREEWE